jgi:ribosomal protein S4
MYRTSQIGTFQKAETRLVAVLIRSTLAAEESHADMLVESGAVFINGSQVRDGGVALFTNDFVQLMVNLKYYMGYRHVLTSLIDKHRRVAKLARYKYSPTS